MTAGALCPSLLTPSPGSSAQSHGSVRSLSQSGPSWTQSLALQSPSALTYLGAIEEVTHSQKGSQNAAEGGIVHELFHAHFQIKQWLCNFLV